MAVVTRRAASKPAPTRRAAPAAKKAAPVAVAKKSAASAKKTVSTRPVRPNESPEKPKATLKNSTAKVQAHDVLRAMKTYEDLKDEYYRQYAETMEHIVPTVPPKRSRNDAGTPAQQAVVDPEDAVIDEKLDRDIVMGYPLPKLRALAVELGLDEQKLKAGILAELEERELFREEGSDSDDEADEDASDEDEEDSEDDEESSADDAVTQDVDREDLEVLNLRQLQKVAVDNGVDPKGLSKDEIISALLDEEENDDAEDGEEEDEEGDEEPLTVNLDDLPQMDLEELQELAEQIGMEEISDTVFNSKLKLRRAIEKELSE